MLVGGPNGRPPNENEIGFPTITIQGFNGFGDNVGGEGIDLSQTYQFVNNLTLIRGKHALKMGGDIRRLHGDATSTNAPFGALDFTRDIRAMPPRRSCSAIRAPRARLKGFRSAASGSGALASTCRTTGGRRRS